MADKGIYRLQAAYDGEATYWYVRADGESAAFGYVLRNYGVHEDDLVAKQVTEVPAGHVLEGDL